MRWAFLFPGQGAQQVGMGLDLARTHEAARRVFEAADRALGFSISDLCFQGPADELNLTRNTQPALVTASVAAWAVLDGEGLRPSAVAGLSLGEYAALVAAGSMDLPDAVTLVHKRGRYQQECVPPGEGAMAAILGLTAEAVGEVCREASSEGDVVEAANFNGPGQIVVSGHSAAVERACELAGRAGARRVVGLKVSAPFHSSLLDPAGDRLRPELETARIRPARVPVISNATGLPVTDPADIVEALVAGVSKPVLWHGCVQSLAEMGVDGWVECGPGTVLSGTVKRIIPGAEPHATGTADGIRSFLDTLGRVS